MTQRIWTPEAEADPPRLFGSEADIAAIADGLLQRTLPRAQWTHEAHIAATLWLIRKRPGLDLAARLPAIIRAYNESVGGVNDDTQGYHDTLTQLYIRGLTDFAQSRPADEPLLDTVNAALIAPIGRRDWPLTRYSRQRLFSVEARRAFLPPDLVALPA